jgi:hypothetical protein
LNRTSPATSARQHRREPGVGDERAAGLDLRRVARAGPDRDAECAGDRRAAADVVGVRAGERVRADSVLPRRRDQALGRAPVARIHQHIAEQVGVHRVARHERDPVDVGGEALHPCGP